MTPFRLLPFLTALFASTLNAADNATVNFSSGPQQVHLLELFTSQGCSSCPPADAWLSHFKHDSRLWKSVVPVAFHVDYWDGLGWRDRFADPAYSARQRQYQQSGNVRSVYTPGFVVSGREWRGWFNRGRPAFTQQRSGILSGSIQGNQLIAQYLDGQNTPSRLIAHIVILGFDLSTPIKSGENSRKTLDEDFVVLWHRRAESRDGKWQVELPDRTRLETQHQAIAMWVQSADSPTPLQASGNWF